VTLLVSLYTSRGIVFAADSQITVEAQPGAGTQRLEPQTKLQRVRRLGIGRAGGVVGYFGLAEMNRQPMDDWLRERIDRFSGSRTVEDFAVYLRNELADATTKRERHVVSGFHIGAFEKRGGVAVPVFHFLRNTSEFDDTTGVHSKFVDYWTEEHFPKHYAPGVAPAAIRSALRDHELKERFPFWLRNGDLGIAGRTWHGLQEAVVGLAALPHFGPVCDLNGFEELAKALVTTTSRLYALLYRGGAPLIGGRTLLRAIPWPE
jgi:hypothetical protein